MNPTPSKDKGDQCPKSGNPIVFANGNKFLADVDYRSDTSGLTLVRYYNGLGGIQSVRVGRNWNFGFDRRLTLDTATFSTAVRPDGRRYIFKSSDGGATFRPDADVADRIFKLTDAAGNFTGMRYVDASTSEVETYDASGRLLSVTDRAGASWSVAYDPVRRIASIADAVGRRLVLSYDSGGRVGTLTTPEGGVIKYAYDSLERLTNVTYPDGKSRGYLYEDASYKFAVTGIVDEAGSRYATYGYDGSGRANSESLAGGAAAMQLAFGTSSTTVTDARNTARTYNFQTIQGVKRNTSQTQPGGSGCSAASAATTYDANANVATRTDFNGVQTRYAYDLSRNLETQRIEAYGKPEQKTTSTQWHSYWRLPIQVAEPLKRTTYVYNGDTANGAVVSCAPSNATVPSLTGGTQPIGVLCQKTEQATTDANGSQGFNASVTGTARTWSYTYNSYGQVLTAQDPRGNVTTSSYYDAEDADLGKRGNLASLSNALGQVTQITAYDLNSRPLTLVDPNNVTTMLTYDLRGRLTSKSVDAETTSYTYDPVGQLTAVSLPDGSSLNYTYDPAHRLTAIADGLGNQIRYTLDALGNRTKEDVLDPTGQLAQTRSRVFDALSRLYKDIGSQNQTTTYAYDANGNLTGITDPSSHTTTQSFDALNRLIRITDPGNGKTQFGYNGQDRLIQVTDPRNLVTAYTVDGLGNPTSLQSPDTGTTAQSFDAAGNVTSRTDAKGQTTGYQYDALNRLIQVTLADGATQRYTWDLGSFGIGRLSRISEQNAAGQESIRTEYDYDAQGRVIQETRTIKGLPYVTGYRYSGGRLMALTYPSGRIVNYSYDAAGRITAIDTTTPGGTAQGVVSQVTYQPFGGVKSFRYANGQTYTRSVDQDGRIGSYTLAGQPQVLGYDNASRITSLADATNPANSASYGYDALDRLTSATLPNASYGYGYDATGNRTTQRIGSTSLAVSISPTSNRIQSVGNRSYGYDANGATTSDGNAQYGYDNRGRLKQVTTTGGTTGYEVNAQGERVVKSANGKDRLYHYDRQGHLIAEGSAQGRFEREYLYLGDLPVAVIVE